MKNDEIKSRIGVDTISKKNGIYTVRRGYYYSFGQSEETIINRIKKEFPNSKIIDSGNHWASFRGGQSVAQGSHWYVKFSLE